MSHNVLRNLIYAGTVISKMGSGTTSKYTQPSKLCSVFAKKTFDIYRGRHNGCHSANIIEFILSYKKMQHFELEQLERLHSEDTPHD